MQNNFWQHKRVLITGATGFVGSHLFTYLHKLGALVTGISRHADASGHILLDITDKGTLERVFEEIRPDICYHLASDALVESGQKHPFETFKNNITGALNVLEYCRTHAVKRLIIASTVHVYGDAPSPYREDEPARPSRPYETSKTCVDLISQSYADTYSLAVVIPRFANIYGPGDFNFTRIIPKTIQSIIAKQPVTLWGGSAKRDYLYISDAIDAYDRLARLPNTQLERNRIFNFGTGKTIRADKLIHEIIRHSGANATIKRMIGTREQELDIENVNIAKSEHLLAWHPQIQLEEGLQKTIAWYVGYFNKHKLRLKAIQKFTNEN